MLKGHAETEHIKYFNKCNFTKMADHLAEQAEIKKAMTGDQKKAAKASCLPPPPPHPTPTRRLARRAAYPPPTLPPTT